MNSCPGCQYELDSDFSHKKVNGEYYDDCMFKIQNNIKFQNMIDNCYLTKLGRESNAIEFKLFEIMRKYENLDKKEIMWKIQVFEHFKKSKGELPTIEDLLDFYSQ